MDWMRKCWHESARCTWRTFRALLTSLVPRASHGLIRVLILNARHAVLERQILDAVASRMPAQRESRWVSWTLTMLLQESGLG
jgi:hypothetical protein